MRNRLPLFYAVTSLFWFALYAYVPPYAEEMHTDVRMIGLITGSYGFTFNIRSAELKHARNAVSLDYRERRFVLTTQL